jgi:hypothetical protein
MDGEKNRRTTCLLAAVSCIATAIVLSGCDTLGQDFNDLAAAIKPTTPAQAARDMMDPYDADKRRTGTVLISNAPFGGVEVYVTAYRDMVLNERDPIVKATAIRALARWGDPSDALRIVPYLNVETENVQVRWEAAKGLQRLHNPVVVPDLIKTLNNDKEHEDVRIAAATALGQYPEDRAFQGLVFALNARELAINLAAQQSLYDITGQSLGIDPPAWLVWYGENVKQGTAFAGSRDFFYPVYWREDTVWEKIMFWTSRNFEKPGQPAGLGPSGERRTYEDDEDAPPATTPTPQ